MGLLNNKMKQTGEDLARTLYNRGRKAKRKGAKDALYRSLQGRQNDARGRNRGTND